MRVKIYPGSTQFKRRDFLRQSALAGLAIAGGLPSASWAVRGKQLHIRNYNDIVSLDPPFQISGAESVVSNAINQSLLQLKLDGTWDTEFDAADYFEQVDDTHYAFRLKRGQMFSNGFGEMTADDLKFSYERIVDPDLKALNAVDMGPLSHVEVHDRYSGTIVLHSPYAAFISIAVAGSTGSILSRNAVESVGGRFSTQPPCGSGPYLFREWRAKRKTVLERNPLWEGPEAAFEEVHIYAMTDDKASEVAFEAGQLDCAQISVESTGPFERNMPPNSYIDIYPSGRNYWLGMNQSNPSLQDIRVRQAIQWAIDVPAVVEAAWFGQADPSTGPVPEGMLGHREKTLIPPPGDPGKARSLLKEAGVALPLRLRLDVNSDSLELTAAQVIQWSLKKVEIEVSIHPQDNSTFLSLGSEEAGDQWQDIQLFFQSFIGSADPYYSLVWFISEQIGMWNWERFSNEEFDRLNDLALATTNKKERDHMYQRMQDLMEASGCYRFITNGVMPQIIRKTIKPAFQPDGYAILRGFRPSRQTT
ncbi:MAG: twin-arginine translocation signal domain-containing protein [Gammaproteobacteria bacterium]|nr:twin-arginine translocation signal domain-containing protein [Gammaproteobacteria bacterium]